MLPSMLGTLLLAGLPVIPVSYEAEVEGNEIVWRVESPRLDSARLRVPLPAEARLTGAALSADRKRVDSPNGADLSFTVKLPLTNGQVQPPFLNIDAVHRVVVQGAALEFDDTLRRAIRYRAGPTVSDDDREIADEWLGARRFGTQPVYIRDLEILGPQAPIARVAPDGGRQALWVVAGIFLAALLGCGVLYRKLARRARWEKTKVTLDEIAREPVT